LRMGPIEGGVVGPLVGSSSSVLDGQTWRAQSAFSEKPRDDADWSSPRYWPTL